MKRFKFWSRTPDMGNAIGNSKLYVLHVTKGPWTGLWALTKREGKQHIFYAFKNVQF